MTRVMVRTVTMAHALLMKTTKEYASAIQDGKELIVIRKLKHHQPLKQHQLTRVQPRIVATAHSNARIVLETVLLMMIKKQNVFASRDGQGLNVKIRIDDKITIHNYYRSSFSPVKTTLN